MQNSEKLNLGCGHDIKTGWINLDSANLNGVDVVHNIEHLPLPFEKDSFNEILCQDVLEHIEYIPVLADLYRISQKNASITIRVPHFTSRNNYADPTHKKMFSIRTFDFFTRNTPFARNYYFDFHFEKIDIRKIVFPKNGIFFFNWLIEKLVNIHPKMMDFYENTFLSRLFPAENIIIRLIK